LPFSAISFTPRLAASPTSKTLSDCRCVTASGGVKGWPLVEHGDDRDVGFSSMVQEPVRPDEKLTNYRVITLRHDTAPVGHGVKRVCGVEDVFE
jgi:hypothetical protein